MDGMLISGQLRVDDGGSIRPEWGEAPSATLALKLCKIDIEFAFCQIHVSFGDAVTGRARCTCPRSGHFTVLTRKIGVLTGDKLGG
jgi:hypothetical protein